MAVLVAQQHGHTIRRTPSSGDGGVDLLIPSEDGWQVRQVKGFVGRMDSGRKKKVEQSFASVTSEPRLDKPIKEWSLTVPIDPTSDEQKWFEDLTAGASFPCHWDGEGFWHAMAASHPQVIDYYLGNGRARVEERSKALLSAADAAAGPLVAMDVAGHLEMLRSSLNRDDPHYRYEFSTGTNPVDIQDLPPGCVMGASRSMDGGGYLSVLVFPRHIYATEDAPIGGTLNLTLFDQDRGIDIRQGFEEFRTFGVALDLPEGSMDGQITAPGGLGGELRSAAGRIGPMLVRDPPKRTRVRLVHADQGVIAELGIHTVQVTRGELGGVELKATGETEVLNFVFRLSPPGSHQALTFNVSFSDLGGKPVQAATSACRFLSGFVAGTEFQWLEEFGSRVYASQVLETDLSPVDPSTLRFFENLSAIQEHVRGTVLVPDENVDLETVRAIAEIAYMIRYEEVRGTWTDLEIHLKEGVVPTDVTEKLSPAGTLAFENELSLQLGDELYELGPVYQLMATAVLADDQPADGKSIRVVPGQDNSFIKRFGRLPDPAEFE